MPPKQLDKSRKRTKASAPHFSFSQLSEFYSKVEEENQAEAKKQLQNDAQRNLDLANEIESSVLSFGRISVNDATCTKFTGHSVQEFAELMEVLKDSLAPPNQDHGGRDSHLDSETRLVLLLNWLKSGVQFDLLGAAFGLGHTHAHDVVEHLIEKCGPILASRFINKLSHKVQQQNNYLFPTIPEVAVIIDCTDQLSESNHKKKKGNNDGQVSSGYSFKHNHDGFRTVSFHACNGLLMHHKTEPAQTAELTMVLNDIEIVSVFHIY